MAKFTTTHYLALLTAVIALISLAWLQIPHSSRPSTSHSPISLSPSTNLEVDPEKPTRRLKKRVRSSPKKKRSEREFNEYEYNILNDLLAPFDDKHLRELVEQHGPRKNWSEIKYLLTRAAAELDPQFLDLLGREDLNQNIDTKNALLAYDYAINGNTEALDHLFENEVRDLLFYISHLDEWEKSIRYVQNLKIDGSLATEVPYFWLAREYLFPERFSQIDRELTE